MNFLLGFLKKWIRRNSKQIIRFWIVFTALVALGMIWLQINSSTRSFPEDSPVIRDLDLVENELAGTDTLRLVFRAPGELGEGAKGANPLKTAKTMLGLEKLQQWLEQQGSLNELSEIQGLKIDKVYSPVTYLDYYRSGMDRLTDTEVERFFAEMRNNEGPAFLDEKEQLLLVTMRMRVSGSTAFLELRELLKEKIPRILPHLSVSFTGGQVLTSESANNIAQGQIQSVFLALAVIFVILSSLFLSWKMGVIALFPNIVAVLIFFGTMGWLSIPIGVTISVIAAIALGIGVDDTIHFLSHYNETAKHLRDKREASMATLPHVVRPMILTTIALSAGFILFVL
ncbi:MAG: MMPL family transporter, partial [SAR324 cluster bacterium]|nr:MMPL family transporter [SAR324 cluster bacterium]